MIIIKLPKFNVNNIEIFITKEIWITIYIWFSIDIHQTLQNLRIFELSTLDKSSTWRSFCSHISCLPCNTFGVSHRGNTSLGTTECLWGIIDQDGFLKFLWGAIWSHLWPDIFWKGGKREAKRHDNEDFSFIIFWTIWWILPWSPSQL